VSNNLTGPDMGLWWGIHNGQRTWQTKVMLLVLSRSDAINFPYPHFRSDTSPITIVYKTVSVMQHETTTISIIKLLPPQTTTCC